MEEEAQLPESLLEDRSMCLKCGNPVIVGDGIRVNVDSVKFERGKELFVNAESKYFCSDCANKGDKCSYPWKIQ